MKLTVTSEKELPQVAEQVLTTFGNRKVILFYGEMGVGKTTLIKQLCKQLGVEEATTSPTFSIVNEYLANTGQSIYHFDFYRIEEQTEVFDLHLLTPIRRGIVHMGGKGYVNGQVCIEAELMAQVVKDKNIEPKATQEVQ